MQLLFSTSLFLSALLLFLIQPMIAKMLLPIYGGTPAVWTICMLFFQFLLLLAYGYVWLLSRFTKTWSWRLIHVLLLGLSLTAFPLSLTTGSASGSPDLAILWNLISQYGFPLLIVGASAPLLQFAYSQTKARQARDPYFLYVISNAGSLAALLAYPCLIEHYIGLKLQFYSWNIVFIIYLLLLLTILFFLPTRQLANPGISKEKQPQLIDLRWISYSFIPCSLMLGVTFYISTDIAATPLFWVIPLALYLLSFMITFAQKPLISHEWVRRHTLFFIIFPVLSFIIKTQLIVFHLASFFMLALLCHGELVRIRPSAEQLTGFYFCLALGGVLAGLFNGLVAPRLFVGAYEYPLVLCLALLCLSMPKLNHIEFIPVVALGLLLLNYFLPNTTWVQAIREKHVLEILAFSIIVIWPKNRIHLFAGMAVLFIFLFSPWFKQVKVLHQQRNFYGVKQVIAQAELHVLMSQSTLHGLQFKRTTNNGAVAYYAPVLPVVKFLQNVYPVLHATIVGLGTGIMACQFSAADKVKMIDIDEQVINIAKNPQFFSYLQDCPAAISLIQGDGRNILQAMQERVELLVMDAFSSDAIPSHLLTLEAFKLYQQKITTEGVIMINISNRHLHLLRVILAAGHQLQLLVLHKLHAGDIAVGQFSSEWVLLTANQPLAMALMNNENWRFVAENKTQLWTDDYSNLLPLLKWL